MSAPLDTQRLLKEVDRTLKRTAEMTPGTVDPQLELSQNVYPLIRILIESFGVRLDEAEGVLMELLQGTESVLSPDVAARIAKTLELGAKLAQRASVLSTKSTAEDLKPIRELAHAYHEAAGMTLKMVQELTVEGAGSSGDDEESEEDGYEEFEGDGAEESGTDESSHDDQQGG